MNDQTTINQQTATSPEDSEAPLKRCRTCAHWSIQFQILDEDFPKSGLCLLVTYASSSGKFPYTENTAATFPRNMFITGPNFGCVLWEPKKPREKNIHWDPDKHWNRKKV